MSGGSYGIWLAVVLYYLPMSVTSVVVVLSQRFLYTKFVQRLLVVIILECAISSVCAVVFVRSANELFGVITFNSANVLVYFAVSCGVFVTPFGIYCGYTEENNG